MCYTGCHTGCHQMSHRMSECVKPVLKPVMHHRRSKCCEIVPLKTDFKADLRSDATLELKCNLTSTPMRLTSGNTRLSPDVEIFTNAKPLLFAFFCCFGGHAGCYLPIPDVVPGVASVTEVKLVVKCNPGGQTQGGYRRSELPQYHPT